MSRAIVTGSFDPITVGHEDLIRRAASVFDEVVVVVADNRGKDYLFTPEQRLQFVQLTCAGMPGVSVRFSPRMLYEFCRELDTFTVCKGVRNAEDLAWENEQAVWNRERDGRIETVYLPSDPAFADVSSTRVREALRNGGSVDGLVPEKAKTAIEQAAKQNLNEQGGF